MKLTDREQQLVKLLTQAMRTALAVIDHPDPVSAGTRHKGQTPVKSPAVGIYPHHSKYNPWRAYVWDSMLRKSVYLGSFTSIAKAKAARKSYREGTQGDARVVKLASARRSA